MDELILNYLLAICGFAFAAITIFGDTYHSTEKSLRRKLTKSGWIALVLLVLILALQGQKEAYAKAEKDRVAADAKRKEEEANAEKKRLAEEADQKELDNRAWIAQLVHGLQDLVEQRISATDSRIADLSKRLVTAPPEQHPQIRAELEEAKAAKENELTTLQALKAEPPLVTLEWRRGKNKDRFDALIARLRKEGFRVKAKSGDSTGPTPKVSYHPTDNRQLAAVKKAMADLGYLEAEVREDGKMENQLFIYTAD